MRLPFLYVKYTVNDDENTEYLFILYAIQC